MNMRRYLLATTAALVMGLGGSASASVMIETTVPEMAREADIVARGRVKSAESRLSGDGSRIFTIVTVAVDEAWKGAPGSSVQIQVPGGSVDGIGQIVQGAARFQTGEEVVVFLQGAAQKGAVQPPLRVVAMAQGKLQIARAGDGVEMAAPDLSGLELLRPGTKEVVPAPKVAPIRVAELKRQVQAALP